MSARAGVNRKRWLMWIALVLALLLGGRMVLRYLDWQASAEARSSPSSSDVSPQ